MSLPYSEDFGDYSEFFPEWAKNFLEDHGTYPNENDCKYFIEEIKEFLK